MSFKVIPAFGRKCQIGQQYDLCNDVIVSDERVWSEEELGKCVIDNAVTETVVTTCFPDELYSSLEIDDNTRLNIELGLFKPKGVARILQDERFEHRGRVKLQHFYSNAVMVPKDKLNRFEALDPSATHVIAGITYGCTVLCQLDEQATNYDGNIYHDLIEEISTGNFDKIRFHEKELVKNNPAKAVPLNLHLWPIANKEAIEIDPSLLKRTVALFRHYRFTNGKCDQLLANPDFKKNKSVRERIDTFKNEMQNRKDQVYESIEEDVTAIRSSNEPLVVLEESLSTEEISPFSSNAATAWFEVIENEMKMIGDTIKAFSNTKLRGEVDLRKYVKTNSDKAQIIVLVIQVPESDPILKQMIQNSDEYVAGADSTDNSAFEDKRKQFQNFYREHQNNKGIHFSLFIDKTEEQRMNVIIHVYKNGKKVDENFFPPPKPENPIAESVGDSSIDLRWQVPVESNLVKSYEVLVKTLDEHVSVYTSTHNSISIAGLTPSTDYRVKVCSCRAEIKSMYSSEIAIKTAKEVVSDPPGKPNILEVSNKKIKLQWSEPIKVKPGKMITKYRIYDVYTDKWLFEVDGQTTEVDIPIFPNKTYRFAVRSKCGDKKSNYSICSEEYEKVMTKEDLRKEAIKAESKLLDDSRRLNVYLLKMKDTTNTENIRKFEFGQPSSSEKEKIVMLLGATGSGKTTLINSLMNYILGISWTDDFRIRLIPEETNAATQTVSQTSDITSYTIYHQEGFRFPYTLTLVDTPGFGDTAGIKRDQEIIKQIGSFFSSGKGDGLDHIDAIGFVAQSSMPRLTQTQRYIFESILSLFGKDISANVFPLLTFADAQDPQILGALEKANVPCSKHFKFNNSALIADNAASSDFDHMFWEMGEASYKSFLDVVMNVEPTSLSLTKEVLKERESLENEIEYIRLQITLEMNSIEQMKKEFQVLELHKSAIARNEKFTYIVNEEFMEIQQIPAGKHITNCITCNRTCHYPCRIPNDENKRRCVAMDDTGRCKVCPEKCDWSLHKNMQYQYVLQRRKVTKTEEDLKKKYQTAKCEMMSKEKILSQIAEEVETTHLSITQRVFQARKCIVRLQEIALKPDPLSTVDYVDLMIAAEKHNCQPGWGERVEQLLEVKKRAVYIESIACRDFDPFKNHRGIFQKVKDHFAGQGRKILHSIGSGLRKFMRM